MNKTLIGIGVIGAIIIAYLAFSPEPEYKSPVVTSPAPIVRTSSILKDGFMEGCVENDPEYYSYCDCTYEYMKSAVGTEGLIEMALEAEGNPNLEYTDIPGMENAINYCLSEL